MKSRAHKAIFLDIIFLFSSLYIEGMGIKLSIFLKLCIKKTKRTKRRERKEKIGKRTKGTRENLCIKL